jgi:hypothetical protein
MQYPDAFAWYPEGMSRPFGTRNRRHRVAERDKRRIAAVLQHVRVGHAYTDGVSADAVRTVAGVSERHARRLLQQSMEGVATMSEEERDRLKHLAPPPAEGTQKRRAVDLRAAGTPYPDIADKLGVDPTTAFHYVSEGLERFLGEEIRCSDTARKLHVERLRALLQAAWPKAMAGDANATASCLRIMEREAKLLGLDAPHKVDISHRLRLMAEAESLDYEELLAEAQAVIKSLPPR